MDIKQKPWMADCEIEIMDSLFQAQRPKRVLEWGAGGSTLYWPQQYDFIEEWVAIEHDEVFAEAVRVQAAGKVEVFDFLPPQYWQWAEHLGQYDMIIVDGRYRVDCLEVARDLLAAGGIVVLHDSGRSGYNEAWKLWPRSEELYPGEKLNEDGYYRHRGITVFWRDKGVRQAGWCREYQAEPLKRPKYKAPRQKRAPEPEPVTEIVEDNDQAEDTALF